MDEDWKLRRSGEDCSCSKSGKKACIVHRAFDWAHGFKNLSDYTGFFQDIRVEMIARPVWLKRHQSSVNRNFVQRVARRHLVVVQVDCPSRIPVSSSMKEHENLNGRNLRHILQDEVGVHRQSAVPSVESSENRTEYPLCEP